MKRCVLTILVLWAVAAMAGAGEPITIGETVTLPSKTMGEERTISDLHATGVRPGN